MTKKQDSESAYFPPIHVSLRFCPVCGRDNRYAAFPLTGPHISANHGNPCPGKPETLRYDFSEDQP